MRQQYDKSGRVDVLWSVPFVAFLAIIGIEYLGVDNWLPFIKVLKVPLLLSIALFVSSWAQYGLQKMWQFTVFRLLVIFTLLTVGALLHGLIQTHAIDPAKQQVGYLALTIAGAYLLSRPDRFRTFAAVLVLVNVCMVVLNWEKLGGTERVGSFVAGYFVGDGNDLAWSLVIAAPLSIFLVVSSKGIKGKVMWALAFVFLALGVVGTQSRGASLAASISLLYLWLAVAKRKTVGMIAIAALAALLVAVAPPQYFDRMGTIATYEEDTSATNRIRAWRRATEMAVDNPVFGVGAGSFNSAYGKYYRDVESGDTARWISPHSIYFKVLGEYGFVGLAVFLGILFSTWKLNYRSARQLRELAGDESWIAVWPMYLNASLLAFAAAGTFLGGVNYPHRFLLISAAIGTALLAQSMSKSDGLEVSGAEGAASDPMDSQENRGARRIRHKGLA